VHLSDEVVKDILFQDRIFHLSVDILGEDELYSRIEQFLGELNFQLKNHKGSEKWRRSVTALIIRGKRRLRELESL